MLLNAFHDRVILSLFQEDLKAQIEKHKLKNVLLILVIETLEFDIILVKLSV
jgi:hypothetical protein